MRSTFTVRVMLQFALLCTMATALVLYIGSSLLERQMRGGLELLHDHEFQELRAMMAPLTTATAAQLHDKLSLDTTRDAAIFFVQVYNDQGAILFRSVNLGDIALPVGPGTKGHFPETVPGLGLLLLSTYDLGALHLQLASPLEAWLQVAREYRHTALLLVLGTGLASLVLGYAFSRVILRPIRAISSTASLIDADTLKERIPVSPMRDELADLARLLNRMFDRLEATFSQVRSFSADASHELKTPLSLIKLNADKLETHLADNPDGLVALDDLREEVEHMNSVIDSLLFLARAQGGAMKLPLKQQRMDLMLNNFAEDASLLAEDRGVRFVVVENQAGDFLAEPILFRQLLFNLLNNALHVSRPGDTITLFSHREEGTWRMAIEDEGPGLPPDKLERIFERFVRLENGMSEKVTHGTGLGLAICRSIAELHGGSIHAENRSDRKGLRLVVRLPALFV